jgi:hypothetical protein
VHHAVPAPAPSNNGEGGAPQSALGAYRSGVCAATGKDALTLAGLDRDA